MLQGMYLMHIFLIITTIYRPNLKKKQGNCQYCNFLWIITFNITVYKTLLLQEYMPNTCLLFLEWDSMNRVTPFFSSLKFILAKDYYFRIFYMLLMIFIFLHLYLKSPCFTACLNKHILVHTYSHYIVIPFISKCSNSSKILLEY